MQELLSQEKLEASSTFSGLKEKLRISKLFSKPVKTASLKKLVEKYILSNAFSVLIEMITCFFFLFYSMLSLITVFICWRLNHSSTPVINPICSWCVTLPTYYWICVFMPVSRKNTLTPQILYLVMALSSFHNRVVTASWITLRSFLFFSVFLSLCIISIISLLSVWKNLPVKASEPDVFSVGKFEIQIQFL